MNPGVLISSVGLIHKLERVKHGSRDIIKSLLNAAGQREPGEKLEEGLSLDLCECSPEGLHTSQPAAAILLSGFHLS